MQLQPEFPNHFQNVKKKNPPHTSNKFKEQKFSNKVVYIAGTNVFHLSLVSKHQKVGKVKMGIRQWVMDLNIVHALLHWL